MERQRIEYLDRLKGLAIIAVVIGHFTISPLGNRNDDTIRFIVSTFHVPLLFFISGYVIRNLPNLKKIIDRFFNLCMPLIIIGGIYSCVKGITFISFLNDSYKSGYWYLWVLMVFYGLLPFFNRNQKSMEKKKFSDITTALAIYIFFITSNRFLPIHNSSLFSLNQCAMFWPNFVLGYLWKQHRLDHVIKTHNCIFTISVSVYVLLLWVHSCGYTYTIRLIYLISPLPIYYIFLSRSQCSTIIEKQLSFLGRWSLDIYIYQYFILWTGLISLENLGRWFVNTNNYILEFLLSGVGAILTAYLAVLFGMFIRRSYFLRSIIYGTFTQKIRQ